MKNIENLLFRNIVNSIGDSFYLEDLTKTRSDKRTKGSYSYYLDEDGYDVNESLIKAGMIKKGERVVATSDGSKSFSLSTVNMENPIQYESNDDFVKIRSGLPKDRSVSSCIKHLIYNCSGYSIDEDIDYEYIYKRLLSILPRSVTEIPRAKSELCNITTNLNSFNCGAFIVGYPRAKEDDPRWFLVTLYLRARSLRKKLIIGSDRSGGSLYGFCEKLMNLSDEEKKEARSLINDINFDVSIGEGVLNTNSLNTVHTISIRFFYD